MKKLAWILGFAAMMPMMSNAKQASVQQVQAEKQQAFGLMYVLLKNFSKGI